MNYAIASPMSMFQAYIVIQISLVEYGYCVVCAGRNVHQCSFNSVVQDDCIHTIYRHGMRYEL